MRSNDVEKLVMDDQIITAAGAPMEELQHKIEHCIRQRRRESQKVREPCSTSDVVVGVSSARNPPSFDLAGRSAVDIRFRAHHPLSISDYLRTRLTHGRARVAGHLDDRRAPSPEGSSDKMYMA